MRKQFFTVIILIFVCCSNAYSAEKTASNNTKPQIIIPQDFKKLDEKVQTIKKNIIKLGHDFNLLEEGLSPISGKDLVVYVALEVNDGFILQAVELTLNGKFASRYEFTQNVLDGLLAGGVKRIYSAKLPSGDYALEARLIGKVGKRHNYSNSVVLNFEKNNNPKTIELKITNIREKFLPEFAVNEWD